MAKFMGRYCENVAVSQVPDLLIVQVAAQKALAAKSRGLLRTRSLHAELVYNLSGSKHVRKSQPVWC